MSERGYWLQATPNGARASRPQLGCGSTRRPHGLTLVEVMVTLAIFLLMATMLLMIVQQVSQAWSRGERDRLLHERAAGALDQMAADLSLALGAEPTGVDSVRAKFVGDQSNGNARVMFVRSFEAGPERALTLTAGDGRPSTLKLRPLKKDKDDDNGGSKPQPQGRTDGDDFTGTRLGDYKPLGGMAAVAWFVSNNTLYRGIQSPVGSNLRLSTVAKPAGATPIAEDVLFFDLDYWHQETSSWEGGDVKSGKRGPEKIWDSTRGFTSLREFYYHRGPISFQDPTDDVFPSKVRITLTVDSPMPRCVYTKLTAPISPSDDRIPVMSTRGFPPGDDNDSFLLIGKEWIQYEEKDGDGFIVIERGARGTTADNHEEGDVIRVGRTFSRTVFIRNYRDDWSSDKDYFNRKEQDDQRGRRR